MQVLENHAFIILDEREKHPEKTMAELYDPVRMPDGLKSAHNRMDVEVENCYKTGDFEDDFETSQAQGRFADITKFIEWHFSHNPSFEICGLGKVLLD